MNWSNEKDFLDYIYNALQTNKLSLPTLPDVALKVQEAVSSGETTAASLAKEIGTDAALSARLIQVANSPLFRAKQKIDNLQVAITRLGYNTVRTLVTSLAMQQMFNPKSPVLGQFCRDIWKHNVDVSGISRALAARSGHLNADQAMLAGLIHQIGKLPVLTLAEKVPELLKDPDLLKDFMEKLHPQLGKMILDSWNFPESLVAVPAEYKDWNRDHPGGADYTDVVQVAYLEVIAGTAHPDAAVPLGQIKSFEKLGLESDIEVLEIEGIADELAETKALLS